MALSEVLSAEEQTDVQAVVDKIVELYDPVEVYLFGSRHRGTAKEGSDWDFLVLVDDHRINEIDEYSNESAIKNATSLDVQIVSEGYIWFSDTSLVENTLPFGIRDDRTLLFKRDIRNQILANIIRHAHGMWEAAQCLTARDHSGGDMHYFAVNSLMSLVLTSERIHFDVRKHGRVSLARKLGLVPETHHWKATLATLTFLDLYAPGNDSRAEMTSEERLALDLRSKNANKAIGDLVFSAAEHFRVDLSANSVAPAKTNEPVGR
ncbi:nucleotidyltransferase domain-containing protein [Mesorhizobium sp. SP-1A]|uniref:nucleotidyltransferase domain-containing protein n=1 Tax=Mesorhizobium sp. SP-1A TaxID=3077840 RepID=UPI0028F74142|nr:nucleotidyltransferase domain-containing protein [Mesorhizobium sp. SP-1A]